MRGFSARLLLERTADSQEKESAASVVQRWVIRSYVRHNRWSFIKDVLQTNRYVRVAQERYFAEAVVVLNVYRQHAVDLAVGHILCG